MTAGTTAPVNMRKQNRVAEWAGKRGLPLIFLSDNDGGRLPDLLGWRFSGVPFDFRTFLQSPEGCPSIPRITAVLGPSFGDAALHAAICWLCAWIISSCAISDLSSGSLSLVNRFNSSASIVRLDPAA